MLHNYIIYTVHIKNCVLLLDKNCIAFILKEISTFCFIRTLKGMQNFTRELD